MSDQRLQEIEHHLRTVFSFLDRSCGYWCFRHLRTDESPGVFDLMDEALCRLKAMVDGSAPEPLCPDCEEMTKQRDYYMAELHAERCYNGELRDRCERLEAALEAWVAYADEISAIILGEAPSLLEDEHCAFYLESSARRLTADALRGK